MSPAQNNGDGLQGINPIYYLELINVVRLDAWHGHIQYQKQQPMASTKLEKSELKQQGAIEIAERAVQDPQSNIRPELVEKVLVEETRKAGVAAYQFDPDASTDEKRAVVQADLPPDFPPEKKPKAVAVGTDVDDGTHAKVEPPLPAEQAPAPAGGKSQLADALRWARNRTGWAPKFADKADSQKADPEGTLLDHPTFLEGKLGDNFFGDWYHNAGLILFACLASGLVVSLGAGFFGILFVAVTCGTYYRTSIRRVRRNFRDDVHREVAKERLESDTESLEWINGFLAKMWPIYAPVLCDTVISSVDPILSTMTPAMVNSLRLKTFILGSKPPRLEHVKTYPNTEVDTVVMDWKFSFTPTDTMDLTARQLKGKINPKVVLEVRVGKGLVSKALDVIVEDMACSGLMKVKMKLQIPFPHIEIVDICFVERPEFDYVCKPLGGDMLGIDINFIPGLESFIKEQIHSTLGPMMYAPNVFPIEIAKLLTGDAVDQAVGVVVVTLHGASQLPYTDTFAIVSLNSHEELGRTETVHDTDSPRWNETIYIIITSFTDALSIQVHHWNEYLKNKQLGTATFALDKLEQQPEHENLTLEVMSNGQSCGAVQADIRFFPVLEGQQLEDGQREAPPELNAGIARFTVEQAQDLDVSKSMVGQLNPYGVLLLNGKEIHITNKFKRTNNPIFQDSSKEFLVTDRNSAKLGLDIKDDRDMMTDPIIGSYQIKLNDMLKMMQKGQEWFQLTGAETGRAKLTLQWKPVALGKIASGGGYVDPIGVMRVHFKNAKGLSNPVTMGKSDSYARVTVSGLEKGRTVTFRNNLDPEWDEIVYVPVHGDDEKIMLEVMHEESSDRDRSLGSVGIVSLDYIHKGETGEYQIHDEKQPMSSRLHVGNGSIKGYLNYTVAFYPAVPVVNPEDEAEEEEAAKEGKNGEPVSPQRSKESTELRNLQYKSATVDSKASKATSTVPPNGTDPSTMNSDATLERNRTQATHSANAETLSVNSAAKQVPKTSVTVEDLSKYDSGFVVFKFHEGQLSHTNVHLEVLMDDYMFPSYISPMLRSKSAEFNDTGETFVRELEFSKITLRLVAKNESKDEKHDDTIAKIAEDTRTTLQQILYTPTELSLRSNDDEVSKVTVSARYIPVKMKLDPAESINNMGSLRIDILDATDLPSSHRHSLNDPYCKFTLNDEMVYKTKVQKKTLHPAWEEFFEVPIKSRIEANLRVDVYGDKGDYLGGTPIDLKMLEPFQSHQVTLPLDGQSGAIGLKLLFKAAYVTRSRQGSSTFSDILTPPANIVGAPVKGVGKVGGGVIKGASFLKHALVSHPNGADATDDLVNGQGSKKWSRRSKRSVSGP